MYLVCKQVYMLINTLIGQVKLAVIKHKNWITWSFKIKKKNNTRNIGACLHQMKNVQ